MAAPPTPTIRVLKEDDILNGFLNSLDSLSETSSMGGPEALAIFNKVRSDPNHVILVAELAGRVVGTMTMLIDQKFIHNGGRVCHIEDVAVSRDVQGMGIGTLLGRACLDYAAKAGCYKTVLECRRDIIPFYERMGFHVHGTAMRFDHDTV